MRCTIFSIVPLTLCLCLAGMTQAEVMVDGSVGAGEWDLSSPVISAPGVDVFATSDADNLYILGDTTDDDDGTDNTTGGFDIFDINIGLAGNTAPWRYRIRAKNDFFGSGEGAETSLPGDWAGDWSFGDDSSVSGSFGEPGGLSANNVFPAGIQWDVDDVDGNRVHEIGIPWDVLLDGNNGWSPGNLDLAFAGFYSADGAGFTAIPGDVDFGDQASYGTTQLSAGAVPEPASLAMWSLIGAALVAVGCYRVRRTR